MAVQTTRLHMIGRLMRHKDEPLRCVVLIVAPLTDGTKIFILFS